MMTQADTLFRQLAAACSETRNAFDRHVGMTQARRQLLALVTREGELSHAALRRQLALDGATVTRLVKQFEAAGMLSRRLDPQDNRYTLVSVTALGRQTVSELGAAHGRFQARLLAGIAPEEQAAMVQVLETVRANIRACQEETQGRVEAPRPDVTRSSRHASARIAT